MRACVRGGSPLYGRFGAFAERLGLGLLCLTGKLVTAMCSGWLAGGVVMVVVGEREKKNKREVGRKKRRDG